MSTTLAHRTVTRHPGEIWDSIMSRRTQRIANLLRRIIGQIVLCKLSDPRIDPAKTSVTRIDVPEDLMTATVYISVLGSPADQRRTLRALSHASGRIQELMGQQIQLRHTPILTFVYDKQFKSTLETLQIIDSAMEEIREKDRGDSGDVPDIDPTGTQEQ